jgi:hypothetical protein
MIGSVILGAILGIGLVWRGIWSWWETRVMLTTTTIAIASFGGLACELSRTKHGSNFLPLIGLALTLVSAGLWLIAIWFEPPFLGYVFGKLNTTLTIFAVATVHVCLLTLMSLSDRFRWVMFIAIQAIYGLALLMSLNIMLQIQNSDVLRLIGVISIVVAALTIVIPLLHRISKIDARATTTTVLDAKNCEAIDEEISDIQNRIAALEKLRLELLDTNPGKNNHKTRESLH